MGERAVCGEKMTEKVENRMLFFGGPPLFPNTHTHIDTTKLKPKERKAEGGKRKKSRTGPPLSR